jgi:hypothetical protein
MKGEPVSNLGETDRRNSMRGATIAFSTLGLLAMAGCTADEPPQLAKKETPISIQTPPAKKVEIGKNVYLEVQGDKRRVLVDSYVCLRKGQLEQLLTRKQTKEHEAILAADVDARHIHAALQAARAEPGSPVKFIPKYEGARGTVIRVFLEYNDDQQKAHRVPAQEWIHNLKTNKDLSHDWVFAGSVLIPDPLDKTKPPYYAANTGDIICVSNFDTALLDLPIMSSKDNDELIFEANTDRIPILGTQVMVILEPVVAPAAKKN